MSTSASIIIKDKAIKLYFYRHSDGYPETTLTSLNKFLDKVKSGEIRNNPEQSSGWLILLGREEEGYGQKGDWKIGAYEPANSINISLIDYLYVVDLQLKEIKMIPENKWRNWE